MEKRIVVILPTYNAGESFKVLLDSIFEQTLKIEGIIVIDSSSTDSTASIARQKNVDLVEIEKDSFNHGGTRDLGIMQAIRRYNADYIIFLTQDVKFSSRYSLKEIIKPFGISRVAAVCGRQLPHDNANPIARHSRIYSYMDKSLLSDRTRIKELGLKAAYMSNSFAAYAVESYNKCGGFPQNLIFGEDMFLAAKMILNDYKTYYASNAVVYHSHNYTLIEEFRRYFDIGVFHASQPFLLSNFGKPSGEGFKFALSELNYCFKSGGFFWMLNSLIRTVLKLIGYRIGKSYKILPRRLKVMLSMNNNYWK